MADIKLNYGTASDVTITLASLASDTNLLAGVESDAIVNTSTLALDYLIAGKVTAGTGPTASRSIEVWAVGSVDGTNWPDVFDGTGSSETITSADIKVSVCRLVAAMATSNTSDRAYGFGPLSLASVFGGAIPPKFVVFVVHNTGVALNATSGNHKITVQPITETVT